MAVQDGSLTIVGLREWRRELRSIASGRGLYLEFGRGQREIARNVAGWAQGNASSMGGPFAHFAGSISGRGGVTGARVGVGGDSGATYWGSKRRTGWNARNPMSRRQHPLWIGSSWEVGVFGQGPYAINNAIAGHMDEIMKSYSESVDRVTAQAFPD